MEKKEVVPKQFIIKLKLTEPPKTIPGVLTYPDIFDRCHIRTRHNAPFFLCLDIKQSFVESGFREFSKIS